MIEIPTKTNFYEMSFLQIIIVILKFIIYFDYNEIEELAGQLSHPEQIGGGEAAIAAAAATAAPSVITAVTNTATKVATNAVAGAPAAAPAAAPASGAEAAAPAAAPAAALPEGPVDLAGLANAAAGAVPAEAGALPGGAGSPEGLADLANAAAAAVPGGDLAAAAAGGLSELDKGLDGNLSNDKDLKGIKKGFINNNWIMEITKQAMDIFSRIAKTVGEIVSRLFMVFIFAATFPALPFFAVMGLMYAFAKYGAFKFRGL